MEFLEKQPELFQDFQTGSEKEKKRYKSIFKPEIFSFNFNVNIEQIVIILVLVVMLNLISFSLGVEKGKRSLALIKPKEKNTKLEKPQVAKTSAQKETLGVTQTKTAAVVKAPSTAEEKKLVLEKFTIQVASFKEESAANFEAAKLKELGFTPIIRKEGKYYSLLAEFVSKKEAQASLNKLKKRYKDCYLRRS